MNQNILTWNVYTMVADESVVILFEQSLDLIWKNEKAVWHAYVPVLAENVPGLGD